ncbi:hypothetical protein [Polaromonas sp. LjRoot131]|uniref:hypothetical protein n=1 Tax=Polaromonas sp. LjRoot131 TaxID=3342262 RepID=UPI003ECFCD5D
MKRKSSYLLLYLTIAALLFPLWLALKHSYIFTVRADGTCGMRLHSIDTEPSGKFLFTFYTPVSGVTEEASLAPNALTFYVLRFSNAAHPEIAISARTQAKPTWRVLMDDEEIERSKATGGIIDFSVSKEALKCATKPTNIFLE